VLKVAKVKSKVKTSPKNLNALLEVGVEEIPARFMSDILEDLKLKAQKEIESSRLKFSSLKTLGTARRLVLYIDGLQAKQNDVEEERKGPPKERAYDKDGNPTQAAKGFANSLGLKVSDLKVKEVGGKEYVFAKFSVKGLPAEKLLSQLFPKILSSLYLPISMKWGSGNHKFIRPIHWIFAACGPQVVNFEFGDIKSSGATFGHRYVSGLKPVKAKLPIDLSSFEKVLEKNGVILDQEKRKKLIKAEVEAAAVKAKGKALIEADLLEEVTYLVENPATAVGGFSQSYLSLPKDILITSMKKNQKYFSVLDSKGGLRPAFIVVTDCQDTKTAQATVVGNERVLAARLADAKFFFDEDMKTSLQSRVDELKKVAFYENLGSIFDKSLRIREIALWIARELKIDEPKKKNIERIAKLCKADLVTKMVFEFTALQGIIGREYALKAGEDKSVAYGISDHYLPRFAGDKLPGETEGALIAIADKLDSIVGCFSLGMIPSGSEDPYALRRQAHGIVEIILGKRLPISLEGAVEKSYKLYEPLFHGQANKKGKTEYKEFSEVKTAVLQFISQRLRGVMLSRGIRYDVADSALSSFSDVIYSYEKAGLIMKHVGTELLKGIVMTSDRIARIAKSAPREQIIETDFVEDGEKSLYDVYMKVNWDVGEAIDSGKNEKALKDLGRLTGPVDEFFEKILVMHKDEKIKLNRLALLKSINRTYQSIADFPKIVIQKTS
jgi:glycyl-tRNA synthetase beta chain